MRKVFSNVCKGWLLHNEWFVLHSLWKVCKYSDRGRGAKTQYTATAAVAKLRLIPILLTAPVRNSVGRVPFSPK